MGSTLSQESKNWLGNPSCPSIVLRGQTTTKRSNIRKKSQSSHLSYINQISQKPVDNISHVPFFPTQSISWTPHHPSRDQSRVSWFGSSSLLPCRYVVFCRLACVARAAWKMWKVCSVVLCDCATVRMLPRNIISCQASVMSLLSLLLYVLSLCIGLSKRNLAPLSKPLSTFVLFSSFHSPQHHVCLPSVPDVLCHVLCSYVNFWIMLFDICWPCQ